MEETEGIRVQVDDEDNLTERIVLSGQNRAKEGY